MHLWDVVGWTFDGAVYCVDHKPRAAGEKPTAILAQEEGWGAMVCDVPGCGYLDPDVFNGEETVQCFRCQ